MKQETRTVVYDEDLRIEAYRFTGIVQPGDRADQSHFTKYFHDYIGCSPGMYREIFLEKNREDLTNEK